MKNKNDVSDLITQKAIATFGERLSSVLLYGSSISARQRPNDLDIIIILKDRETPRDVAFLQDDLPKYHLKIDLQVINLLDCTSPHFSHDTHGEFFVLFLRTAKVMYGQNPFLETAILYSSQVSSVIKKMQYYYFRARKIHANNPPSANSELLSFHRKKVLFMLLDFWLVYSGHVLTTPTLTEIKKILTVLTIPPHRDVVNFLTNSSIIKCTWSDIFALYQSVYFTAIDKLQPSTQKVTGYTNNIYWEHTRQNSEASDTCIIIASGCPTNYNEDEILTFLTIRKYDVVTFHYSATGKSTGIQFVPPEDDLKTVLGTFKNQYKKLIVIGNSYGGFAALSVTKELRACDKIIAISPVIDFSTLKGSNTLAQYVTQTHKGFYRFSEKDMSKYLQNTGLITDVSPSNQISIIHGQNDPEIASKDITEFCSKHDIGLQILPTKHLSLNRLSRDYIDSLDRLL